MEGTSTATDAATTIIIAIVAMSVVVVVALDATSYLNIILYIS